MSSMHRPLLAVATCILLSSCGASPPPSGPRDLAALDAVTSGIMGIPVTTSSADARTHFLQGQRELDLARNFEALDHFKRAVAADSTFAIAYLNVANTGNSLDEFKTNLARAEQFASGASDAEQLEIQIARRGFENDVSGQLEPPARDLDRKSTRLNSSHGYISYAVFCLKKKKASSTCVNMVRI